MKIRKKPRRAMPEILPGRFSLTLSGRSHMLISGVDSIRGYCPEKISLETSGGSVTVFGADMLMISCFEKQLTVRGIISAFEFDPAEVSGK